MRIYKYHIAFYARQRIKRKRKGRKKEIRRDERRDALNIGNVTTAVILSKRCDAQIILDK